MPMFRPRISSLFFFAFSAALAHSAEPVQAQQQRDKQVPPKVAAPTVPPGLLLFNEAIRLTEAGQYAAAERTYRQLLKEDPNAAAAWANLGLLAARKGERTDEAIGYLRKATKLSPGTGAFWSQLSSLSLRARRWDEVVVAAQKALGQNARDAAALTNLAAARMEQGKYAEAIPSLNRLRALRPQDKQTEASLIFALKGSGRTKEAVEAARKFAARYAGDINAQLLLSDLAGQSGNFELAKEGYTRAFQLQPNNVAAGVGKAVATLMCGDRTSAREQLTRLMERFPTDSRPIFQLGYLSYTDPALSEQDRYKQAEGPFRTAMLRDPKNPQYIVHYAASLLLQGQDRYEEAGKYFSAALKVAPPGTPFATMARKGLAHIAEQTRNFASAGAQYRALLTVNPNDYPARRGLAGALYAAGKKEEAYREFNELAARHLGDTTALTELGSLLVADNKLEEAKKVYERALARNPEPPIASACRVSIGRIHEQKGEPAEAQKQYEAALKTYPASGGAALALGGLLAEQKKTTEAVSVYEKAVAADPRNNPVRYQLGQTYLEMRRYDEAMKHLRALILQQNDPNRVEYQLSPIRVLVAQKKADEALEELKRLRAENPREERFSYEMAEVLEGAGKHAEAAALLKEIVEGTRGRSPGEILTARLALGQFQLRRSDWNGAAETFEEALRLQPGHTVAFQGLSQARTELKQPDRAAGFLEEMALASSGSPTDPDSALIKAVQKVYESTPASDKYRDFARRLSVKFPQSRIALRLYAAVLLQGKPDEARVTEAIGLYRKAADLDPRDWDSRYQIGLIHERRKENEPAITAFREAYRALPDPRGAPAAGLRRLGAPLPDAIVPLPARAGSSGR